MTMLAQKSSLSYLCHQPDDLKRWFNNYFQKPFPKDNTSYLRSSIKGLQKCSISSNFHHIMTSNHLERW